MYRRHRRTREIPFSFDSFLDVVANVVGIIIRLILVVWVGARSYSSIKPMLPHLHAGQASVAALGPLPADPLEAELARGRAELQQMQARLLEQLRDLQLTAEQEKAAAGTIDVLARRDRGLDAEASAVERVVLEQRQASSGASLTLAALNDRRRKLTEEIRAVEKLPPLKKVLRYRTPVSQPVKTDEFFFECKSGRVTFVDIASLKAMAEQDVQTRVEELRRSRAVEGTTLTEGAFRLRYQVVLRDESVSGQSQVQSDLSVEPMQPVRGETSIAALAAGSQFRQVVDRVNPKLAAVTFWVYPDSFAVFRALREYLYEKDIVVAGRALPESTPIRLSTHAGSASRGQ